MADQPIEKSNKEKEQSEVPGESEIIRPPKPTITKEMPFKKDAP